MCYVEYKIIDDKYVVSNYRIGTKMFSLTEEEANNILKEIIRNKIKGEQVTIDDVVVLRYSVPKEIIKNNILPKEINRNVTRKNKFNLNNPYITLAVASVALIITINGIYQQFFKNDIPQVYVEAPKNFLEETLKGTERYSYNYNPSIYIDGEASVGEGALDDYKITDDSFIEDDLNPQKENYQNTDDLVKEEEDNFIKHLEDQIENNNTQVEDYFDFVFEDRSNSDKAIKTRELYYDLIDKYAKTYGLPTNLMLAIATQELGVHSTTVSEGGGYGLFQIQTTGGWVWQGKNLTAMNFDQNKNETVTVCLNDNNCIDVKMLGNLEYNIKIGCMVMREALNMCNNDLILAIQYYNSGNGVRDLKKSYGEDWVNHRGGLSGDPNYLEHVLSFVPSEDNVFVFKDNDGNNHAVEVNNVNNYSKTLS